MRRIVTLVIKILGLTATVAAFALLLGLGLGPHTGRYRTMTVLTDSMRPGMPAGSVAVQTPMPASEVAVGDVITYRIPVEGQRVVTHRVVEVVEAGARPVVVTKGDAVGQPDPWVARLEGPVVWRTRIGVPKLGYLLQALQQPLLRRILVLGVPMALALLWLADIWRADRRSGPAAVSAPSGPPGHRPSLTRALAVGVPVVLLAAWAGAMPRSGRPRRSTVTVVGW